MPAAIILMILLFGFAEVFTWMQNLRLPLPVFMLGGLFLAIASNYDKRSTFPLWPPEPLEEETTETEAALPPPLSASSARPISFKIRQPQQQGPRLPFED